MALLEMNDVHVSYGQVRALRGINLEIEAGERVALLGTNGAGKSTTLRAISGMIAPKSGEILLDGEPIHGVPAHKVAPLGISHGPEGRELFSGLTVEENLRFGFWPQHEEKDRWEPNLERAFEQFPRLEERRDQAAGTMSGGEQQMLVVARALMSDPKLVMVDELSLGLAPMIVTQLFEILERANERGTSVLIVEQFVHMALEHTDRAYVLGKGEIVLEGTSKELRESPDLLESYLGGGHGADEPEPAR